MISGVKKYKILQYMHQISHLDLTIWQIFVNTFLPNVHFWPPWKHQKTCGFFMFSGGSKENIGKKRVKHIGKENECINELLYFMTTKNVNSISRSYHKTYWEYIKIQKNFYMANILFLCTLKASENEGFLSFSGGIEKKHWLEMS